MLETSPFHEPQQATQRSIKRGLEYWRGLHQGKRLPSRTAIDPLSIPKDILPNVILVDIEHDPFRVFYRLVGTAIVKLTGFDYTGRYLDELDFGPVEKTLAQDLQTVYFRSLTERAPQIGRGVFLLKSTNTLWGYEFGIFPLSTNGKDIDKFIAFEDMFDLKTQGSS